MGYDIPIEKMCCRVAEMNRDQVTHEILNYHGRIKLDFTESFLDSCSVDRLRHILVSAIITDSKKLSA